MQQASVKHNGFYHPDFVQAPKNNQMQANKRAYRNMQPIKKETIQWADKLGIIPPPSRDA